VLLQLNSKAMLIGDEGPVAQLGQGADMVLPVAQASEASCRGIEAHRVRLIKTFGYFDVDRPSIEEL
jgi:hypothetical protein